jgi:4-hydroxy-tetrahydrodipicolinate synthase
VKDSSGEVDHLAALVQARGDRPWSLLVGEDRLLQAGLRAGWDGAISGVAGFCPELLVAIHQAAVDRQADEAARLQRLLDELMAQMAAFPTPWAVRIGLAARGIPTGPLPLPVTAGRREQISGFTEWFRAWLPRTGLDRVTSA